MEQQLNTKYRVTLTNPVEGHRTFNFKVVGVSTDKEGILIFPEKCSIPMLIKVGFTEYYSIEEPTRLLGYFASWDIILAANWIFFNTTIKDEFFNESFTL